MRAGRQGAGDRLSVDVTLVGEGQTDRFESATDVADSRARAHDDAFAIEVGAHEARHGPKAEQQTARRDHGCEGMAGTGDADGKILPRGLTHERDQFVFRSRLRCVPRDERLVADPVSPMPTRAQLRRRLWRDVTHLVAALPPPPAACPVVLLFWRPPPLPHLPLLLSAAPVAGGVVSRLPTTS